MSQGTRSRLLRLAGRIGAGAGLLLAAAAIALAVAGGGFAEKPVEEFDRARNGLMFFAHRGAVTPGTLENTAPAIRLALEKDIAGIEVDIQVARDGRVFLFHDSGGQRLMRSPARASGMTLEELQAAPLFLGDKPVPARIMSGDELMAHKDDFAFYLDVKRCWMKDRLEAARQIAAFIHKHGATGQAVVGSADVLFTLCLEYLDNSIKTCLERPELADRTLFNLIPRKFRPDFFGSALGKLGKARLARMRGDPHLRRLIVWGVTAGELDEAINLGVRNCILDYEPHAAAFLRRPVSAR